MAKNATKDDPCVVYHPKPAPKSHHAAPVKVVKAEHYPHKLAVETLHAPRDGQHVVKDFHEAEKWIFDFNLSDAKSELQKDGSLLLHFDNDATIKLVHFQQYGGAEVLLQDGSLVAANDIAGLLKMAGNLESLIEPASGQPGGSVENTGAGFRPFIQDLVNIDLYKTRVTDETSGVDESGILPGNTEAERQDEGTPPSNPPNNPPENHYPDVINAIEDTDKKITEVSVSDREGGPLTSVLSVQHGTLSFNGTIPNGLSVQTLNDGSIRLAGSADAINAFLQNNLHYQGDHNFGGANDTLTITTTDSAGLSDTDNVRIHVEAVADAPALTHADGSGFEHTVIPFAFDANLTDTDGSERLTNITFSGVPVGSVFFINGVAQQVNAQGQVIITNPTLLAQINAGTVNFAIQPPEGVRGHLTLHVEATSTEYSNGSAATSATDIDIAIHVDTTNTPPENHYPAVINAVEDTDKQITGVSVSDKEGGTLTTVLSVQHGTLSFTGNIPSGLTATLQSDGSVKLVGSAALINSFLATQLHYLGDHNFGGANDNLHIVTTDSGGLTDVDDVRIHVEAVADAPALTHTDGSGFINTVIPFAFDANLTDTDGSEKLTNVTFSGIPVGSTVYINGTAYHPNAQGQIVLTDQNLLAQLNAGTLTFGITPADGVRGHFTIHAEATSTENSNGSAATSSTDIDIAVHVDTTNTNTPPENHYPAIINAVEDTDKQITGISVSDKEGGTLTTILSVQHGTLSFSGALPSGLSAQVQADGSVKLVGSVAAINSFLASQLHYLGDHNFGGANDTLHIETTDAGGLKDIDNVTIKVEAVADAPAVSHTDGSGFTGTVIPFQFDANLTDTDGSEKLSKVVFSGVPLGSSFYINGTAHHPDAQGRIIITDATLLAQLHAGTVAFGIQTPDGVLGHITLHVEATSTEQSNGSSATSSTDIDIAIHTDTSGNTKPPLFTEHNDGSEHHPIDFNNIHAGQYDPHSYYDALAGDDWVVLANSHHAPSDYDHTKTFNAGAGDDHVTGSSDSDTITLGAGHDYADGGAGNDIISGGDDNDIIHGGDGFNILSGDAGDDYITGGDTDNHGHSHDVTFADGTHITSTWDEFLYGGEGNDNIKGGAGWDVIDGGKGNDHIDGGTGNDYILGGAGNDMIAGGAGNDTINAGSGNNSMTGGDGDDRFVFLASDFIEHHSNGDQHTGAINHITDFSGGDVLDFSNILSETHGDIVFHQTDHGILAQLHETNGETIDLVLLQGLSSLPVDSDGDGVYQIHAHG